MEENKNNIENIDEIARAVIEPLEMKLPDNGWNFLDAELTKKQAAVYKRKANRFKVLSLFLAFLLLALIVFKFIIPSHDNTSVGSRSDQNVNKEDKKVNASRSENLSQTSGSNSIPPPRSTNTEMLQSSDLSRSPRPVNVSGTSIPASKKEIPVPTESNSHLIARESDAQVNQENAGGNEQITFTNPTDEGTHATGEKPNQSLDASKGLAGSLAMKESAPNEARQETSDQSLVTGNSDTNQVTQSVAPEQSTQTSNKNADTSRAPNIISRFSIAAYYAPTYAGCNLKDNVPNDAESTSEYKDREKFQYAFSTGLLFRYDLTSRWTLQTGCSYSEVAYNMTYTTIYVKYGWDNQLHYQYPTSYGIVEVPNQGNNTFQNGDSVNMTVVCDQRIQFLNVPLMIRYQTGTGRIKWYANVGFAANILLQESMDLTLGNKVKTITGNVDGIRDMNFSFVAGAGVEYNFYRGFGIFGEPVFRTSINSLTYNIGVNCLPYSVGLNAGLSCHF